MDPRFTPDPEQDARFTPDAPAPKPGTAADTAADVGTGFLKGATFNLDDEIAGATAWLASKVMGGEPKAGAIGTPKGEAAGVARGRTANAITAPTPSAFRAASNARKAEVDAALQRSPTATKLGEVGGTLASAALTGGGSGALGSGSTLARIGKLGAYGAGASGLAAAGASEADTPGGVAADALPSAVMGGVVAPVLGVGAPALVRGIGGAMRGSSEALANIAARRRLGATGAYGADIRNLARDKGEGAVRRFAEASKEMRGGAMLPSPSTYKEGAKRVLGEAGPRIGAANEKLAGADVDLSGLRDDLLERATKLSQLPNVGGAHAEAERLFSEAAALDKGPISYDKANELRAHLGQAWKDENAATVGMKSTAAADRLRNQQSAIRGAMNETAAATDPEAAAELKSQLPRYEAAKFVAGRGQNREMREAGNLPLGLHAMILGGGALAGGGNDVVNAIQGHGDWKTAAEHGLAGAMAGEAVKRYGNTIASDVAGSGAKLLAASGRVPAAMSRILERSSRKTASTAVARVIAAAAESPRKAAIEHYVQNETDPSYREAALAAAEDTNR